MVLEHALIMIRPGAAREFEQALKRARPIIAACPGFISLELRRGVEAPDRYLLLVEWETLDDHLVGFRRSKAFPEWRAVIGPYFESPPVVDHFAPIEH
jgi:heme-degrading monooxygenase HmoA